MAGAAWWLIKQSINVQPWVAQGSIEDVHGGLESWPPAKIGLWVFLAVVAVLFMLLIAAYAGRMAYEIWRPVPQLSLVFLLGQILAWRQLATMDYFEVTNPAIAFFYLITGLHGLHLLGGLVAWGRTAARVWGDFDVVKVRQSLELCAVYWHFLLVVWLVLFGLLFSGNNLNLLLTICGIR